MSTDAVDVLVTSSPLRADAVDAASDLLATPPPAAAKSRPDSPPPTVPTPELPPDSTTSDSPTGELNGTSESYSDGRVAQHLQSNSLSCPEPSSTCPETSSPTSTIGPPTDIPERPVIATVNGANKPRKPARGLQNLDQIVKKLTTVQNGHKTETRPFEDAAVDLTTKVRPDDGDGPVKAVKWDIMKRKGGKDPRKKTPTSASQPPVPANPTPVTSENFVNPLQLLRIPQYVPQSQPSTTDPNKVRSELRMMGLTGGATVVTRNSSASQTPQPHTTDDKRPYDKRFEVRPTALVNPFPGGEASSSAVPSRSFPAKYLVDGFPVAKGTQVEDFGRAASKGTQFCVPNGNPPLWNPMEPDLIDLEKKRYPVPIVGPKKRRDRPTKVSNFHKLAASLVTTAPSAVPAPPAVPVAAKPATGLPVTVKPPAAGNGLAVKPPLPTKSLAAMTPPPVSFEYALQPATAGGVRGAAKRKRTFKSMMPIPSPQMSSVGQQTLPVPPDLPSHLLANPGQPPMANPGHALLQAGPGQSGLLLGSTTDFSVANMLGGSGGAVSITPLDVNRPLAVSAPVTDQAVVDRLKRLGTVIEVEEDPNVPTDKEPIGAPSALKMLEKMTIDPPQSPVVSALDDRPLFLGKEISVYPKKKALAQQLKNSPLSIIPVGLANVPSGPFPMPVIETIKSLAKDQLKPLPPPVPHLPLLTITKAATEPRSAAVPPPVVTVTKTASTSTQLDGESDSEPPLTLFEPVIVLDEDDPPNESPLSDGYFVFRHDSNLSVELPNDQKVFSCDICSAAFHHLHMLRKHYFRLHVARKYISEKDLEAYNIDPEKCEDSNDVFIYRCHTCRQCLPTKTELKSHLTDHPPVADLTKHIKGAKDYKCEKCNMHFKWRKMFGKHKRNCRVPIGKVENVKKPEERDESPSDESPVKDQPISSVTELALRQVIDIRAASEAAPIEVKPAVSAPEINTTLELVAVPESEAGTNIPEVPPGTEKPLAIPSLENPEETPGTKKAEVTLEDKPGTGKRSHRARNPPPPSKPLRRTRQTVAMAVHSPPELPEECLPPSKVPEPSQPKPFEMEQPAVAEGLIDSKDPITEPTPRPMETPVAPPVPIVTCDGECQTTFNDELSSSSIPQSIPTIPSLPHETDPDVSSDAASTRAASPAASAPIVQPTDASASEKPPSDPEVPLGPAQRTSEGIATQTDFEPALVLTQADSEPKTEPKPIEATSQTSSPELVTKESFITFQSSSSSQSISTLPVLVVSGDKSDLKGLHHCLYCNETFSNGNRKRSHTLKEHPYVRKSHPCVFCKAKEAKDAKEAKTKTKETFQTPSALFSHLLAAHPTVYFACQTCKERFLSLDELRDHTSKRHSLDKGEQKELDCRTSEVGEATSFSCPACSRVWLFKTCMLEHKCAPEKDKPSSADKLAGRVPKLRKVKAAERLERPDKPIRVDPETMFYSQVALNVRSNLLHFLDGKVPQDEEEEEVEDEAVKIPERISFSAGFPSSSGFQLIEEPEPYSRVKAQWEKYSFPKNYDGRCGLTSYIKDMSYLDISTQMIMRRNLQRLQGSEVTSPSTSDDVPSSLALERLATQCAESFGINGIPGSDREAPTLGELSGEWVRDRVYICSVCSWETPCLWSMEDHKYEFHPQVLCPQHELVGDQRSLADTIYKRVVGGPDAVLTPDRPNLRPPPVNKVACTKCGEDGWSSRAELHIHILACAGEPIPQWAPTPRKRRWPKKRRRPRRGLKRNIPSTPHRPIKVRTKPGDTDTIQKMIANLPAKRSTRRVIGFDDDSKARSQSTIPNCPVLLPSNRLVLPPSNHHKLSKGPQRASPRPKELIYAPIPKETDLIDTSAERGDVLSSLRMMPVSTPREQLLEPRQIIDKVIHQKVFGHSVDDLYTVHRCTGCGETLESKIILRKHQKGCAYFRECGPNAEHKCKACSNKFENLVALIEHSCDEMPKLEIEKDLSPANSADIPVLSPVENQGKKSESAGDGKPGNGGFGDADSNMKRKRSHSLGDIPSGKKVFRPGHRRSARLGHAESGPLETTQQEEKPETAQRAVTDSEDTSDLPDSKKPSEGVSHGWNDKPLEHPFVADIKADLRAESPSVHSESLDGDSLWEKQAVVEDDKQADNAAEDKTPKEAVPKKADAKVTKGKHKKPRRPKRLTRKKMGRWVPKALRLKPSGDNENKTDSKPHDTDESKLPDGGEPPKAVVHSSDTKSVDTNTIEIVIAESSQNSSAVVVNTVGDVDKGQPVQPEQQEAEEDATNPENDQPAASPPRTKKGQTSKTTLAGKKSKVGTKNVVSGGAKNKKLDVKKGGKIPKLKVKIAPIASAGAPVDTGLHSITAEGAEVKTVDSPKTGVENKTPFTAESNEFGFEGDVVGDDHLAMAIDAVASGTAEALRAIMKSNDLTNLLDDIPGDIANVVTDVPTQQEDQKLTIVDAQEAQVTEGVTKGGRGQKKGKKDAIPPKEEAVRPVGSEELAKSKKKLKLNRPKSVQCQEPNQPNTIAEQGSEVLDDASEKLKVSQVKKKSKDEPSDAAGVASVEPEAANSNDVEKLLKPKRKSRTPVVKTQNENSNVPTDQDSVIADEIRNTPKTRGKSKTTVAPKSMPNDEPNVKPDSNLLETPSVEVMPENETPALCAEPLPKHEEPDCSIAGEDLSQVKPDEEKPVLRKRSSKASQKIEEPDVPAAPEEVIDPDEKPSLRKRSAKSSQEVEDGDAVGVPEEAADQVKREEEKPTLRKRGAKSAHRVEEEEVFGVLKEEADQVKTEDEKPEKPLRKRGAKSLQKVEEGEGSVGKEEVNQVKREDEKPTFCKRDAKQKFEDSEISSLSKVANQPDDDKPALRTRSSNHSTTVEDPEVSYVEEEVTSRVTRRSKKESIPDGETSAVGDKDDTPLLESVDVSEFKDVPRDGVDAEVAAVVQADEGSQKDKKSKKKVMKNTDVKDVDVPAEPISVVDVQTFYSPPHKKCGRKGTKKTSKAAEKTGAPPETGRNVPSDGKVSEEPGEGNPSAEEGVSNGASKGDDGAALEPNGVDVEKPKPKNKLLSGRLPSAGKAAALLSRKPLHQLEPNPVEDPAKKRKVVGSKATPAKRLTRSNSNGKEAKSDGTVDPYDYNEDEIVPFQEPRYKPYSPPKPVLYAPPAKRRGRKREASPDTTTIVVQAEVHPEPPPRRRLGPPSDPTTDSPVESSVKRKSPSAENSMIATKKSKIRPSYDGIDVMKEDDVPSSPTQLVPVDLIESESGEGDAVNQVTDGKSVFSKSGQLAKGKSPLRTKSPIQRMSSRESNPGLRSPARGSPARVASPVGQTPARAASPVGQSPARVASPVGQSPARATPSSPKTPPVAASPVRVSSPALSSPGRASPLRPTLPLRSYGRPPKAASPPSEPPELVDESKVTIEEKLDADCSSPLLEPSAGPLSDLFDSEPPALEAPTDLAIVNRNTSISGDDTETTLDTEEDTDSLKGFKASVPRKKSKDFLLKKKKQLLRIKALRSKKKKDVKKNVVAGSGKEVVKIAGISWEVSDLKTSPVKAEPEPPPPKPPAVPPVLPSLVKDWDAPDLWDTPIVPSAPAPVPVASSPTSAVKSEPRPTQPSMPPVTPGPRSTRSDSSTSSGPISSLGSILDSVNKILNEPESNFSHLPSHYSLADLQNAMGASDAEMAVLQQLGEATQLSLHVGHGFEEPTLIAQADEEWDPMIMDLDNQAAQQPIVSSSVAGSPRRSPSTESAAGPPVQVQPTAALSTSYQNRLLREDLSNLIKSSSMCKSLRMSPKCSSSTSLLAAHNNKEVVCPTCSRHFMGFPALQIHVNKVHGSTHDPTQVTGGLQNRRVVLESVKNSARLVCFECQQILPSQLMPRHLQVDHELEPSDTSKCSTIAGESHGERLKSKMSSALGDLFDKAVNNLLQVKVKPPQGQPDQSGLSGGAVELLSKLCAVRRRDSSNRANHKDMSFNKLKSDVKTEEDSFLLRGLSSDRSRPYLCTVCGQRFPLAASRNKHEVLAHRSFGSHEHTDLNAKEFEYFDDDDWRDAPSPTESAFEDGNASTPSCYSCSDCGLSFETVPDLLKHRKEDHAPRRRESTASSGPPDVLTPRDAPPAPAPDTSSAPYTSTVPDASTAPDSLLAPSVVAPQKITMASRSQSLDTNFLTGDFEDSILTRAKTSSLRPGTPGGSPPTKRKKQRARAAKAPQGTGVVKAKAEDALKLLNVPRS